MSRLRDAPPSRRCSADESVPALAVSSVLPAYPFLGFGPLRGPSTAGLLPRWMRRARCAPASQRTKSLFVRRRSCRSVWLEARGERASLRSAPASSSLAVQPFGWGSLRRPWWRGVRREVLRLRDRDEAGFTPTLLFAGRNVLRRFEAPLTLGASDASALRRLCSDPARIRRAHLAMHPRGCQPTPCGARQPRPTFDTGWVTRVNWMVERSDL